MTDDIYSDFPVEFEGQSSHIKVVGVGGGGCNIVAEMFNEKLEDVDLVICNTDAQALEGNPVNKKIKLGAKGTNAKLLGTGCNPQKGKEAAIISKKDIEAIFDENTEMVFITTCLGGGTGTGASPVIAQIAKEKGKLVVAVVTIPFKDEGLSYMERAINGLKELKKCVDSIILIDNQKIYEPYGDISINEAYSKVNKVLITAVRGISEIVTINGKINIDMNDVRWIISDSGTTTIGMGSASIEEGVGEAVQNALNSPLLNDCDFSSSKGALLTLSCDDSKIQMSAKRQAAETVQSYAGNPQKFKAGLYTGKKYGDRIYVTVVISGFNLINLPDKLKDEITFIDTDGSIGKTDSDEGKNNRLEKKIEINGEVMKSRAGVKPVLIIEDEEDILKYENEPAYLRKEKKRQERHNTFDSNNTASNTFNIREIENNNVFNTSNSYLHKTQD